MPSTERQRGRWVPRHRGRTRRPPHRAVLNGVVVEALCTARGHDLTGRPVPEIVPAVVVHAVYQDVRVRLVEQGVLLNRLGGAFGVADENLKTLLDDRIETRSHLARKWRSLS